MLLANHAIANRIENIKTTAAINLQITPNNNRTQQTTNLSQEEVNKISTIQNVKTTTPRLEFIAQNPNTETLNFPGIGTPNGNTPQNINTNLQKTLSGIEGLDESINIPLRISAMNTPSDDSSNPPKIISGTNTFSSPNALEAIINQELATQNSLKVADTFNLGNETIQIIGIFEADIFGEDIYIPTNTGETISGQQSQVTKINVTVNNIDNVNQVESDIKKLLANQQIRITSSSETTQDAIKSLLGVKNISFISFIGSLITASAIIFLMMTIIVRERRREIGVLKAIGAPNKKINTQFAFESLSLVTMATSLGIILTTLVSKSIIQSLVNTQTNDTNNTPNTPPGPGNGMFMPISGETTNEIIGNISVSLNFNTIIIGLLGITIITTIGSLAPAWLTTKIRPIEALRGE